MKFFRRERKAQKNTDCFFSVKLLDAGGNVLFDGPLDGLRFSEELIIAKSVSFFNDPEPCYIHRGAVAARLFGELNFLLEKKEQYSVEELNEACPGCLDEYGSVKFIQRKGEKP